MEVSTALRAVFEAERIAHLRRRQRINQTFAFTTGKQPRLDSRAIQNRFAVDRKGQKGISFRI